MSAKNSISRLIDRYENLNNQEIRILLEHLLHHWTADQRRTFTMAHPMIAKKLNPGCVDEPMANYIHAVLLEKAQD